VLLQISGICGQVFTTVVVADRCGRLFSPCRANATVKHQTATDLNVSVLWYPGLTDLPAESEQLDLDERTDELRLKSTEPTLLCNHVVFEGGHRSI